MNTYDIGDQVRITGTFTNVSGAAADPTGVTIYVRRRNGPVTTYIYPATITKSSTGVFYADYTITDEGVYDYRIVGTGAVVTASEGTFGVSDSAFVVGS